MEVTAKELAHALFLLERRFTGHKDMGCDWDCKGACSEECGTVYAEELLSIIYRAKKIGTHTCTPPPADPQFRGMRWKCECGSHWSFSGTRWLQEQT